MVNPHIAAEILKLGKKLAPDRFPKPDPDITQAWAIALDRTYPEALWADSVFLWATQRVADKMCTPRNILDAATDTVRRWESNPDKKSELEHFRHQRLEHKYRTMLGDSYTPKAVPPAPPTQAELEAPAHIPDIQELKRRIRQNRNRTIQEA